MKLRSNQKGMSPLIIILLLLLLGIIGFTGWFVWNSNKTGSSTSTSAESSTKDESKTEKRIRVEPPYIKPPSEAYRVILPSAWVTSNCSDSPDLLFLAQSTDKLGKCQSEYFGTVAIAKNTGNIGHNEEYYTSDDAYADVTYTATTIDGITGYKVAYTVATENELGVPKVGTKIVQYFLYDGTNTFSISYSRPSGEPALTATVQTLAESFDKL